MVMLNDLDRYHLVMDVIDQVPALRTRTAGLRQRMVVARLRARTYTREHGADIPRSPTGLGRRGRRGRRADGIRVILPDVLTVNAGSASVRLTRRSGGRDVDPPHDLDAALGGEPPAVVVHRVVHGGDRTTPEVLDDAGVAALRGLTELAPLHQPAALDAIDRCQARWPAATQVACCDTAFHAEMPAAARMYALPERLRARVRVYGFHGLSLCGVLDGRWVVTTMGFTPLDGLVMATRSGTVDPGAVLYLARHTEEDLDTVLESESGLLGLTGAGDMREILRRRDDGDDAAALALDVWLHRFLRQAGGVVAVLGGLDVLVFTGGIGENSAAVRGFVSDRLAWLGPGVRTLVTPAREDLQMIVEAERLLARPAGGPLSSPG